MSWSRDRGGRLAACWCSSYGAVRSVTEGRFARDGYQSLGHYRAGDLVMDQSTIAADQHAPLRKAGTAPAREEP